MRGVLVALKGRSRIVMMKVKGQSIEVGGGSIEGIEGRSIDMEVN